MKLLRTLITVLILLAFVAIGVLFALQNKQAVPLDLLIFSFSPRSLALWILVSFGLGGLAGLLVSSLYMLRSRTALGATRRRLVRTEAELAQLRSKEVSTIE